MNGKHQTKKLRDKDLIRDYQNNIPVPEIVGKYGVSSTRIYQILNNNDVGRRGKLHKKDRNERMAIDFKSGKRTALQISKDEKISLVRVYQILKDKGINVKE